MPNPVSEKSTRKASVEGAWRKGKTRNDKRRNGSEDSRTAAIESRLQQQDWSGARALIQEELVFQPTDHWLWMSLGLTYYEQQQYEKALKCNEYAVQLQPDCSLALWHYAGALYMTSSESSALAIWTMLLNRDLEEIAYGEHGEGMDWALQLVNDVHYRIGRYYQRHGQDELARQAFQKHLHNRDHGVGSIYDRGQVESLLQALVASAAPTG
jgi:tetratricopeptide (TPR) repeat protein